MTKVLTTALILWPVLASANGVLIGNGGDLIHCRPDPLNGFSGDYTLDYLVTYNHENNNGDLHPDAGSLETLQALLNQKLPSLGASLARFTQLLGNTDASQPQVWRAASLGLVDLQDELLIEKLPPNCLGTDGKPELTQAVVREQRESLLIFNYDVQLFRKLESLPLQRSFLLTHEWLWSHVGDARVNRDVNRYLHTSLFAGSSHTQARAVLKNLGMNVPRDSWQFPFEKEACPNDGTAAPMLLPLQREFEGPFAPFFMKTRTRSCDPLSGCNDWTESGILATTSKGRLNIKYENSTETKFDLLLGYSWPAASCLLRRDSGAISCSEFTTPTGGVMLAGGKPVLLKGHASSRCLKLQFQDTYLFAGRNEESEYALVSEFFKEASDQ